MKKSLLTFTMLVCAMFCIAQSTNWQSVSDSIEYLAPANARVGIGTSNPLETLDVRGNIRGNYIGGAVTIKTDYGTTQIGAINWVYSHFYTDRGKFWFNKEIMVHGGRFAAHDSDLKLMTGDNLRMIITQTGNVGIGMSTPQYKLDVAGSIHSNTLITPVIQTNGIRSDSIRVGVIKTGAVMVDSVYGADFVFENNYQLRPLQEVYSYVQEHGHLPEIQSASDMQQNGVNMSEFQIQLLQKIEELTLYIIKQEEQLSQQESRIKELEDTLNK